MLPSGVAFVGVQGGQLQEIEVLVDPRRMAARNLALSDVATALANSNVLSVVGRIQDHNKLLLLALDDTLRQAHQVRDTVVQAGPGGVVRVGDIAQVGDSVTPQWIRIGEDGHPAVQFQVYQQPNANSVAISAAVRQALATFQPQTPAGITLSN